MDPFTIAALVSLVGGAFLQNQAQESAAKRQQATIRDSLERQQSYQRQAEQTAMQKAQEFAPQNRQDKQDDIEQNITQQMLQPVQQQADIQSAPSVQGDVSTDYTTAKAASQAEQLKSAETLARIFGRTGAASELRQGEAIGLGDTGQQIDTLHNFSQGQGAADQYGINAAGIPNGGAMLAGTVLQGAGQAGLMGAFDGLKSNVGNVWTGAPNKSLSNLSVSPGFSLGGSF
jgi:hypothetical protein